MDLSSLLAASTLETKVNPDAPTSVSPDGESSGGSSSDSATPPTFGFIFHSSCHLHRYTRNESDAHIVERADRLRSVFMGVAIAHGRLSGSQPSKGKEREASKMEGVFELETMLGGMNIGSAQELSEGRPFTITSTPRRVKFDSPAVFLAHGSEYAARLAGYLADVAEHHAKKESEVPEPLSQGDLYLCQESIDALEGALGACCEAVDQIYRSSALKARRFVSIRPPGHHCESENPMGFCWLNNVAVAAAHAHLEHGVDRVIIFDIDLHHGNGTQQIAWRLNALAHNILRNRQKPSSPRKGSPKKQVPPSEPLSPVLQIFYGSLHDVDSYPCEELDPTLIANASVNISGGGGSQYITNVHLQPYASLEDFHERLYPAYEAQLMGPAASFLEKTKAESSKTMVIVSAGFDASEHEYASMSRHGAKVPTCFFSRFARDVTGFANVHAQGKLLAVLEGGYSQRALCSGAGSFVSGLVDAPGLSQVDINAWWTLEQIEIYEKALSPPSVRGKKSTLAQKQEEPGNLASWRIPALATYSKLVETIPPKPASSKPKAKIITPPSSSVRATRSRYNSPAPAKNLPTFQGNETIPAKPAKETSLPNETPVAPPLSAPNIQSLPFLPATPLIRFTFKAGDNRPEQPDFTPGNYRDPGLD